MNITKSAIKYNRVTFLSIIVVILLGLASYKNLPRDSMPPFTIRVASIVTNFPGASPERVEQLITDKIEKIVQEIPEVDYISSTSRTGLSVISVSLKDNTPKEDLQKIWDRLRRKIDVLKPNLPSGIYGPTVKDEDIGVVYGISIGLTNDGFEYEELEDYAEDLRDKLIKLDNASKVEISGMIEKPVFFDFNNSNLARLGISSSYLKNIIASTNIIIPAGEINLEGERIILEPSGNFENLNDIKEMLIPIGDKGEKVKLSDITNVYRDYVSPINSIVKINGRNALALAVSLKEGANIVQLGQDVDKLLVNYNKKLPIGIKAKRIASQDYDVSLKIDDFINNVIQSIIIVLIVMILFLGFRTGLVVATLIPSAIILTLLGMNQINVGLNQVSLASLIMALGMLVDNAIVMAESMITKISRGASKIDAAILSSKELAIPLLVSSLTTSAAFLSFYLAESTMGEMMGQLFLVITLSLLSSWILTLTIIPLLAMVIIKVKKEEKETKKSIFDKINVYYNKLLLFSLNRTKIVILSIVGLLIISLWSFKYLPFQFMPESERNLITIDLNMPLGTDISITEKKVGKIESFIEKNLLLTKNRLVGISDWSTFIGIGPKSYDLGYSPGEQNSSYAHLLINTSSGKDNAFIIKKLEDFCFNNLPDAETTIKRLGVGGGASAPIQIRISGKDPVELYKITNNIKQKLYNIKGTKNIDDNWGPKIKKFYINIDKNRLGKSGITNQDIALSLNTSFSGNKIGEFRDQDKNIDITMRSEGSNNITYDQIESINIFSQSSGKNVPLAQVGNIIPKWQYSKVIRRDLLKTITISSQIAEDITASDVTNILIPYIENLKQNWKSGYSYELGGESESSGKAMKAVAEKLPLSLFIILILLVLQFNSIRKTSIILFTIPLGIIGVVFGLFVAQSYFSFTAFLGIISLAGIIINNAIVLIDRIQYDIDTHKLNVKDAIIAASNERFRPILLTTFTTSLGLLPLWFGGGLMWEPMAITVIFGLLFATVITLLFVPVVYKIFFYKK